MDPFLDSDDDNSIPEDEKTYVISKRGVEEILGWIRFQSQLCEMIHEDKEFGCEDKEHEIALLMAFALTPWLEYYKINTLDEGNKE